MTDDLVGRLRERMAAATALPWVMNPPGAWWDRGMTYTVPAIGMDDKSYYPSAPEKEDAELIVEAVNALPTLLARIEALEAENRKLREVARMVVEASDLAGFSGPLGDAARAALTPDADHAD